MAIAKKCDICGKLYESYSMGYSKDSPNGFMFLNIDNKQVYFSHAAMDCCPDCISKIKKIVKNVKSEDLSDDTDTKKETFCVPFEFIKNSLQCPCKFINPAMLSEEDICKIGYLEQKNRDSCKDDCEKCWRNVEKILQKY